MKRSTGLNQEKEVESLTQFVLSKKSSFLLSQMTTIGFRTHLGERSARSWRRRGAGGGRREGDVPTCSSLIPNNNTSLANNVISLATNKIISLVNNISFANNDISL